LAFLLGTRDLFSVFFSLAREDADVMIELGLVHLLVGEASKAFELFGTALAYDPKDARVSGCGAGDASWLLVESGCQCYW
jgi:hypothetical protein